MSTSGDGRTVENFERFINFASEIVRLENCREFKSKVNGGEKKVLFLSTPKSKFQIIIRRLAIGGRLFLPSDHFRVVNRRNNPRASLVISSGETGSEY